MIKINSKNINKLLKRYFNQSFLEVGSVERFWILKYGYFSKDPINKELILEKKIRKNLGDQKLKCQYLIFKYTCCHYKKAYPLMDLEKYYKRILRENGLNATEILLKLRNKISIDKLIRGFDFHMTSRIRLSGDLKHISLMEKIYGKKYTKDQIKKWLFKGKFVIKRMENYLK